MRPCTYYNYVRSKEIEFTLDNTGGIGFMFGFSTKTLTVKEETLLYPFESFLAEFGGSLGLFLGLSFLSLWEFFTGIINTSFMRNHNMR